MNKIIIALISVFCIILAVIFGVYIYSKTINIQEAEIEKTNSIKVSDNSINNINTNINNKINTLNTNSEKEKISPNTTIILKTVYTVCGHSIETKQKVDEHLVNKTKEEIEDIYFEYNIEKFNKEEIILLKNKNTQCGEHYIVKNINGFLEIYKIAETGEEILYQKTDISVNYLTDTDKINIEKGLIVEGRDKLNLLLEDYGS